MLRDKDWVSSDGGQELQPWAAEATDPGDR